MTDETVVPEPSVARRIRRAMTRTVLMIVVPVVVILAGVTYYYAGGRYVQSENAYVKAPITSVVAQVSGRVAKVLVAENENVLPGQKLLQLEPTEFELAVAEAKAKGGKK